MRDFAQAHANRLATSFHLKKSLQSNSTRCPRYGSIKVGSRVCARNLAPWGHKTRSCASKGPCKRSFGAPFVPPDSQCWPSEVVPDLTLSWYLVAISYLVESIYSVRGLQKSRWCPLSARPALQNREFLRDFEKSRSGSRSGSRDPFFRIRGSQNRVRWFLFQGLTPQGEKVMGASRFW